MLDCISVHTIHPPMERERERERERKRERERERESVVAFHLTTQNKINSLSLTKWRMSVLFF